MKKFIQTLSLALVSFNLMAQPGILPTIGKYFKAPSSLETYEKLCGYDLKEDVLESKKEWKPICEIVKKSPMCEGVKEHEMISCQDPSQAKVSYWDMVTSKECLVGLGWMLKDMWDFIKTAAGASLKWTGKNIISNKERIKSAKAVNDARHAVGNYLAVEYEKIVHQMMAQGMDKPKAEKEAMVVLIPELMSKLVQAVSTLLEKEYYKLGCYNPEERAVRMCKFYTEAFFPPVVALGLLVKGTMKFSAKTAKWASDLKGGKGAIPAALKKEVASAEKVLEGTLEQKALGLKVPGNYATVKAAKDWFKQVRRLDDNLPDSDKVFYKLVNDLNNKQVTKQQLLGAVNQFKKGENPLEIAKGLLRARRGTNSTENAALARVFGNKDKVPNSSKSLILRLDQENPGLHQAVLLQLKNSPQSEVTALRKSMAQAAQDFAKTNDPVAAVTKRLGVQDSSRYVPLTHLSPTVGGKQRAVASMSQSKAWDNVYANADASMLPHIRVTKNSSGTYIVEGDLARIGDKIDAMAIKVPEVLAKQYRSNKFFRPIYSTFNKSKEMIDRIVYLGKQKWRNVSDAIVAKRIQRHTNSCKAK